MGRNKTHKTENPDGAGKAQRGRAALIRLFPYPTVCVVPDGAGTPLMPRSSSVRPGNGPRPLSEYEVWPASLHSSVLIAAVTLHSGTFTEGPPCSGPWASGRVTQSSSQSGHRPTAGTALHGCCVVYTVEAGPSTSNKITARLEFRSRWQSR